MICASLLLLLAAARVASGALVLNSVTAPDALERGAATESVACASAALFNGTACAAHAQCSAQFFIDSVDALKTEAPISLVPSALVSNNALELIVQHAAVKGRVVTSIVLSGASAACNYPGPFWAKSVQPNWAAAVQNGPPICRDVYVSRIPWTTACGLVRTENATFVKLSGSGTVSYNDSLGSFDGVSLGARAVASVIRFEVLQPRVIRDITTKVRVYDDPRLLGAVTRQLFDFKTGLATLQVAISLAAPMRATALLQAIGPRGANVSALVKPGFGAGEVDLVKAADANGFRTSIETLTEFINLYNATERKGRVDVAANNFSYVVELVHKNAFLDVIDFGNREGDGNFRPNVGRIPLGQTSPLAGDEQYGVHIRALVTIPVGTWRIAIAGDDGLSLQLDDVIFTSEHGTRSSSLNPLLGAFGVGSNRIGFELPQPHKDTIGEFNVTGKPLTTMLRIYWYERTIDDSLELAIAKKSNGVAYPDDFLLLRNGTWDWTVRAVDEGYMIGSAIGITPIGIVDNSKCRDAVESGACLQRWDFSIDPRELCSFSGAYSFQWAVDCHPSVKGTPDCPVDATQKPLDLTIDLESEDICAVASGLLEVNGSITSHGEFTAAPFGFGPVKTAFFVGQRIHFQVVAQSVSPGFAFENSSIILVEAVDATGKRRVLFDDENGGAQAGWEFQFAADPANAGGTLGRHVHQFSYRPTTSVFGAVARGAPVTSAVIVAMRVNFQNRFGAIGANPNKRSEVQRFVLKRQAAGRPPVDRETTSQTVIVVEEDPNAVVASTAAGPSASVLTNVEPEDSAANSLATGVGLLLCSSVVMSAMNLLWW